MKKLLVLLFLFVVFLSTSVWASEKYYIVKPMDTLWNISTRYYKNPSLWGKVWHNNTYINDPNLIFPGEVLWISKRGLVLMSGVKPQPKHTMKQNRKRRVGFPIFLDTVVWYNSGEHVFYGKCGTGYCGYLREDFSIGKIAYDKFNHPHLVVGDKFFIRTSKVVPPVVYVYRKLDYLRFFGKRTHVIPFVPIASAVVFKRVAGGYWARVMDESDGVSYKDIVSPVYPYVEITGKDGISVGNVVVKCVSVLNYDLAGNDGYYFLLKLSHPVGYITGKFVEVGRVVDGVPGNVPIVKGYVTGQYDKYVMVFSHVNEVKEVMDCFHKYVLR